MQQWWPAVIASAVATGAVSLVYVLIRKTVMDALSRMEASLRDVWKSIDNVRDQYMEEKTHDLLCARNTLEIEKMFKECLKLHADDIFKQLRVQREHMEERINDVLKKAAAAPEDKAGQ